MTSARESLKLEAKKIKRMKERKGPVVLSVDFPVVLSVRPRVFPYNERVKEKSSIQNFLKQNRRERESAIEIDVKEFERAKKYQQGQTSHLCLIQFKFSFSFLICVFSFD